MANGFKAIAIAVIVLLAAFASGLSILFNLAYALVALVILSGMWAWANVHWLPVKRETRTARTQVGKAAEERLLALNTSLVPKLWVEIRDQSTLPDHHVSQAFMLPPKASKSWTVRTTCRRRGKYTLGPCTVTTGDPFGMFRGTKLVEEKHPLIVYPATIDLPRFEIPVGELHGGYALRKRTQQVTPIASGVRDYIPGDSLNRIHWPSTARAGHLMAREFELDPASDIWIALDMDQTVQAGFGDDSTEEYGVTIGASIANHFLDRNRAVGLVAYGTHREVIHSDRGTRQLLKLLECLAVISAEGRTPLAEVIMAEGVRFGRNTTVIAISPSTDEAWTRALKSLAERGVRIVAVILEASTFGGPGNSMLVVGELMAAGILTYLVKRGDRLDNVFVGMDSR